MSNKGILFSEPLIPSLLDLSKTMTRRLITPQPKKLTEGPLGGNAGFISGDYEWPTKNPHHTIISCKPNGPDGYVERFAPWSVGDILFVREVTYVYGWWEPVEGGFTQSGKPKMRFVEYEKAPGPTWKYSDSPPLVWYKGEDRTAAGWHKRPSLFMKRHRARIFLEVLDVRVEQLQQISENDARREGMKPNLTAMRPAERATAHTAEFIRTIKGIHGPEIWDANPWMWVLSFKRVDKPANWQ